MHLDKTLSFVPILIDDAELPNKVFLEGTLGLICDHQSIRISTDDSLDFMPIKRYLRQKGFLSITPPLAVTPILGEVPKILIEEDEKKFLRNNKTWRIIESEKPNSAGEMIRELYRLFEFTDYPTTWEFMTRVHKDVIMVMNYHPRW